MEISPKQQIEVELASRLLAALGCGDITLDPSDRPDVLARIRGLCVGIEVTQFHADGKIESKGSPARADEECTARRSPSKPYFKWGYLNPHPALVSRISDKIETARKYDATRYDQLWLLIAASIPKAGAFATTFVFPDFVGIEELNRSTHKLLLGSPFEKVYIHVHVHSPLALFCWSRERKWHVISGANG